MKRIFIAICMLVSVQIISAQIITSKTMTIKKTYYPLKSGYRGFVEGAATLNVAYSANVGFDVLTTHGYQCGNWFYIGVGAGFIGTGERVGFGNCTTTKHEQYTDYIQGHYIYGQKEREEYENYESYSALLYSIPAYLNARIYLSKTKVKPFFDFKAGYMFSLNTKEVERYDYKIECDIPKDKCDFEHEEKSEVRTISYNGIYGQAGFGLEAKHFDFSLNYSLRGLQWGGTRTDKDFNFGIVTVNLGVNF